MNINDQSHTLSNHRTEIKHAALKALKELLKTSEGKFSFEFLLIMKAYPRFSQALSKEFIGVKIALSME